MSYQDVYKRSIQDPNGFWGDAAQDIVFTKKWDKVLDDSRPPFYKWFSGAELNTCYNAVDIHVEQGRGDQLAIIYDSPVSDTKRTYTYSQFLDQVSKFAGVLKNQGVEKGDRVIVYMPMIPEALIAMLACARLGAVHSVVFGGFAPNELATRIDDAKPKVIVSASCGIEGKKVIAYKPLLDDAIDKSTHQPDKCVIVQRPMVAATLKEGRDLDWATSVAAAEPAACVSVQATDPLYILYTSGTTGQPKGIVRDNGGHAVAIKWTMKNIYNVEVGDVYWAASDVGWVVGHSYIVYGPLLKGCTTVIYEGKPVGTPDPGAFWRMINEYKIKVLFTAPTAFRAIKKEDPNRGLDIADLPALTAGALAGSPPSLQRAAGSGGDAAADRRPADGTGARRVSFAGPDGTTSAAAAGSGEVAARRAGNILAASPRRLAGRRVPLVTAIGLAGVLLVGLLVSGSLAGLQATTSQPSPSASPTVTPQPTATPRPAPTPSPTPSPTPTLPGSITPVHRTPGPSVAPIVPGASATPRSH